MLERRCAKGTAGYALQMPGYEVVLMCLQVSILFESTTSILISIMMIAPLSLIPLEFTWP